jgi:hypothetical protein
MAFVLFIALVYGLIAIAAWAGMNTLRLAFVTATLTLGATIFLVAYNRGRFESYDLNEGFFLAWILAAAIGAAVVMVARAVALKMKRD